VLDIMLPGMDGLEVLTTLRRESDVYVILLTARVDETDRVVGLTLGADDYVTKPFSPRELAARIRAALRRLGKLGSSKPVLLFRGLRIDSAARRVWRNDEELHLTPREFDLLQALAEHNGMVLSREQLLERVWGTYYGDARVVDVHIGNLRRKLGPLGEWIATVRGVGYRFDGEPAL
jgi:two-component system alkaline phosphatase synthesis response regulator PhoP